MTQRQKHGIKAGITVLMLVSGVGILPELQAASSPSAVIVQEKQWRPTLITLDVRNAPVRYVLEMLFKVQGCDYAINSDIVSSITIKTREIPLENVLHLTLSGTTPQLTYIEEGDGRRVFIRELISDGTNGKNWMGPEATVPVHVNAPLAAVPIQANRVEDIKWHVSGVLIVNDLGTSGTILPSLPVEQAIIETAGADSIDYRVVKVGDRVPIVLKSIPLVLKEGTLDFMVTKITPKGVTLETSQGKKQKIQVPLLPSE